MSKEVYWVGEVGNCDFCEEPIEAFFVDGRTKQGPWANMCLRCHTQNGIGLGLGKGQLFEKVEGNRWLKIQ